MPRAKRLVSISDLTASDIEEIFALAQKVKRAPEKYRHALEGRMFGLIFEKPSTRTWISFEVGLFSLGGGTIYLGPEDIKLGQREEVRDVARVLDRYLAGIVLRTFSHETIEEFASYFTRPVINGLSDREHPCQALSDFFTIREKFPAGSRPTIAFVGDGNNMLHSLMLLAAKLGASLKFSTPRNHAPDRRVVKEALRLAKRSRAAIEGAADPAAAVRGADVIYTDVWVSMGEEKTRARKIKDFAGFQVNHALLRKAKRGVRVMHCLPAHRGEEITEGVLESRNSIVFDQAENRLHVQKAILIHFCNRT